MAIENGLGRSIAREAAYQNGTVHLAHRICTHYNMYGLARCRTPRVLRKRPVILLYIGVGAWAWPGAHGATQSLSGGPNLDQDGPGMRHST